MTRRAHAWATTSPRFCCSIRAPTRPRLEPTSTGTRPTQDSPTSFVMGVTRRLTSKRRGRPSPMRVLGISGSLRRDSHNTKLLRHGRELFEAEGVEFEIY